MEFLAKFISPTSAEIIQFPADENRLSALEADGFVEFVQAEIPVQLPGQNLVLGYLQEEGRVVQTWTQEPDGGAIMEQINTLKSELAATDYKVIKCFEASMVGIQSPYDIIALQAARQAIRGQINQLETQLAEL